MLNRIEGAASFLDSVQVLLLVAQHRFLACQFFLGCFDRSLKVREFFPGVADSLICCEQFPLGRACEALHSVSRPPNLHRPPSCEKNLLQPSFPSPI